MFKNKTEAFKKEPKSQLCAGMIISNVLGVN